MRKVLHCLAVMAFTVAAGGLSAQGTGVSQLSSPDVNKADSHDRPLGKVRIKLPTSSGTTNPGEILPPPPPPPPPVVPPEGEDLPPTPTPPEPPKPVNPPTYFGEPVDGKFAFLLDASGSMYGSRIATVRAETTGVIGALTEDDEFDCVAYGTQFSVNQSYSKFMWGNLLPGTDINKAAATEWVNGPSLNPGGGTPTYACLKKSCETYPADLDKMFLLTDGSPNTSGSASQILADFPGWWSKFNDTEFVAICIGGYGAAQTFMQQLAALAGGTYIAR
ncbi:MAG: hypothetical protein KDB82_08885 [Planctomycetes bacterium]|nr:hypothetical protein [Planctomycetota bacterium]